MQRVAQYATKIGVVVGTDTINYTYDAIGNLVSDVAEEIDEIQWYVNGKIKAIKRTGSSTKADLYFAYGPDGQRIRKVAVTGSGSDTTWYVRDAQGNPLAIYQQFNDKLLVTERYFYGNTRVGTMTDIATVQTLTLQPDTNAFARILGEKQYELTNHLGNVLATISDQKKAINSSGTVAYWVPKVVSYSDYMPFGSQMVGRKGNTSEARFGFNGQEKDDEVYGTGNSMTAEFWQYDARLGRRWNVDPVVKEYESPYSVLGNSPILIIDVSGADSTIYLINKKQFKSSGSDAEPSMNPEEMEQIRNEMLKLLENAGLDFVNVEIVSEEEFDNKELDPTDAFIYVQKVKPLSDSDNATFISDNGITSYSYISFQENSYDAELLGVNTYQYNAYAGTHEIIHQYLGKISALSDKRDYMSEGGHITGGKIPSLNHTKSDVDSYISNSDKPDAAIINSSRLVRVQRQDIIRLFRFQSLVYSKFPFLK